MSKSVRRGCSLRQSLLLGVATAAAAGLVGAAQAQEQTVETVVVTGSRIPQQGLYSSSPVTAVGQEEMKFQGTTDVVNLLDSLPSVFVEEGSYSNNGSTGSATLDLRGLGSERTLVLIDGTRLMPGDPILPSPDVNTIPAALVDHVEVLTGGASAVYGSDAEAGVVNFIMRRDFQGIEVDGQWSGDEHGNNNGYAQGIFNAAGFTNPITGASESAPTGSVLDGESQDVTLIMGTNTANDKGNVTAYLAYRNSAPVIGSARDFAACTFGDNATNTAKVCGGSGNYALFGSIDNEYNYFGVGGAGNLAPGTFQGSNGITPAGTICPSLGYYFETGKGKGASFGQCYSGAPNQKFNYGALNYLQRPDTRYNGGFFAHYEVNKELDVYSDFMFTDDQSTAQLAPSAVFDGGGPLTSLSGSYGVNCTNPYLTPQENEVLCGMIPGDKLVTAATPGTPGLDAAALGHSYWNGAANLIPGLGAVGIGRRNIESNDRTYTYEHEAYRMKVGAKGELGDGWAYDVYGQYGYTSYSQSQGGQIAVSRIQNALNVDPITGRCVSSEATPPTSSGCQPLDIFQGFGGISPAAEDYVTVPTLQVGYTKEQILSGSITGDLGEYGLQSPWAKSPVAVSFGSEYRQEALSITPDAELSAAPNGDIEGGSRVLPEFGTFNVVEGFTEVKVPVVQDKPFFEDLSFNGGYRYSSYNIAGANSTYKAGFEWQPIDDFRLRGSIEHAVRAPNVLELFSTDTLGLFNAKDPCVGATGVVAANCASAPGAAKYVFAGQCPASQCNVLLGGNLALKPEVSETHTIGIVATPTFLNGFTATVDYFDIQVANHIGGISPGVSLAECYGQYATPATQASFCPFIVRGGNGGPIFGTGYVDSTTINGGNLGTKGFDFEANYAADFDQWGLKNAGSIHINMIGTLLNSLTTQPVAGGLNYDCAGLYGYTCSGGVAGGTASSPAPRWRHKLRVTWDSPWDFSLSADWRYIGSVELDQNTSNPLLIGTFDATDAELPAMNYFDLAGDWNVRDGVDLRAGVNNVFDKDPPLTTIQPLPAGAANTFPGTYDALGRYIFVGVTIKY